MSLNYFLTIENINTWYTIFNRNLNFNDILNINSILYFEKFYIK